MDSDLTRALRSLCDAINSEDEPRELARYLLALTELRALLADCVDECSARLASKMDKREEDLGPPFGIVRRTREANTQWDHVGLFQYVVAQHRAVDEETGEIVVDGQALADDIRAMLAFSYWRKNELKSRQIDPEEFSTTIYGKPRIRFLSREGKR